jgi:hypothetical protein
MFSAGLLFTVHRERSLQLPLFMHMALQLSSPESPQSPQKSPKREHGVATRHEPNAQ